LVIDTNVVLDLFVFNDPTLKQLKQALEQKHFVWLATQQMRDELAHVLTYPHLAARMQRSSIAPAQVLHNFDTHTTLQAAAPRADCICKDPDDQIFIDLAVQHRTTLLSKDKAVLSMAKRLLVRGASCSTAMKFVAQNFPPASVPSST
jgi:putative PIN family toxin of toxin-antitoxin system